MSISNRIKCCDRQMNPIRAPNITENFNKKGSCQKRYKKSKTENNNSVSFGDVLTLALKERKQQNEKFY